MAWKGTSTPDGQLLSGSGPKLRPHFSTQVLSLAKRQLEVSAIGRDHCRPDQAETPFGREWVIFSSPTKLPKQSRSSISWISHDAAGDLVPLITKVVSDVWRDWRVNGSMS
jgi:hypothetical protein